MSEESNPDLGRTEFYKLCALGLPSFRPTITDLAAGNGTLALACSSSATHQAFLLDGENVRTVKHELNDWHPSRVWATLQEFYPILMDVGFKTELIVCDVRQSAPMPKKDWLRLDQSRAQYIKRAYEVPGENVDSALLTMMVMLDLMSQNGEGMVICDKKVIAALFDGGYRHLDYHCWAKVIMGESAIIHFALDHNSGCRFERDVDSMEKLTYACMDIKRERGGLRGGKQVWVAKDAPQDAWDLWTAAKSHHNSVLGRGPKDEVWNLSMSGDRLNIYISLFDRRAPSTDQAEAVELPKLADRTLVDIVLNRATRDLFAKALKGKWLCEPGLKEKFEKAVKEHYAARAPVYPLSPVMSIGFLEDCDEIVCLKDLYETPK